MVRLVRWSGGQGGLSIHDGQRGPDGSCGPSGPCDQASQGGPGGDIRSSDLSA